MSAAAWRRRVSQCEAGLTGREGGRDGGEGGEGRGG